MTKPKTTTKFKVGDRVAERPKPHGTFATTQQGLDIAIKQRSQRYGTVVELCPKKDRRGIVQQYIKIQWDNLKSPTEHFQGRICFMEEFQKYLDEQ